MPSTNRLITLSKDDIHVWIAHPKNITEPLLLSQYENLLTQEEQDRRQRYKFEHLRHDALITRALVRTVLSNYENRKPEDWRFENRAYGKPEITSSSIPLRFNISHTKNLIICAVCLTHEIGADVECTEKENDVISIAEQNFSSEELNDIISQKGDKQKRNRFFDYWTLKESHIKASGMGMSTPLNQFSFQIGENEGSLNNNIKISFLNEQYNEAENWQSWLFYLNNYRLALSVRASKKTNFKISMFKTTPLVSHEIVTPPYNVIYKIK
jgi:4'-phosphopantetheinyl transferase